jgi:hypothetical protein
MYFVPDDRSAMLSAQEVTQGRRGGRGRRPPSLKQQYYEYIQQRIETYKNSLPQAEVYALGDEANQELLQNATGQFVLTEIMLEETVDNRIRKRLRLSSYRRWRAHHAGRREAQRNPVRWDLDPSNVLVSLLPRLEDDDEVLVVGAGAKLAACLLAAHDVQVTFVDKDFAVIDQIEARVAEESLGMRFFAYSVRLGEGEWFPPFTRALQLVVIDAGTLGALSHSACATLIARLTELMSPGGVHAILPGPGAAAPEAFLSYYHGWIRERVPAKRGRATRSRGVILTRPCEDPS